MTMHIRLVAALVAVIALASCSTPKNVVYFQDAAGGAELISEAINSIKIQPKDQLFINVTTGDPRLNDLFNITVSSTLRTQNSQNSANIGYTVDSKGDIDFPLLGSIHIAGMTRDEVEAYIKGLLQSRDLVRDPVVTVSFQNLSVAVMGEVNHPGKIYIKKDKITLLDALAEAGDLTINGRREDVIVIRNTGDDEQVVYKVDLTNAESVYNSPAYYLQQEDYVYVSPNPKAVRSSTINGNTVQTYGFWMSVASLLVSVAALVFKN